MYNIRLLNQLTFFQNNNLYLIVRLIYTRKLNYVNKINI